MLKIILVQGAMRNAGGASKGTKETSFPSACYFDIRVFYAQATNIDIKETSRPCP